MLGVNCIVGNWTRKWESLPRFSNQVHIVNLVLSESRLYDQIEFFLFDGAIVA